MSPKRIKAAAKEIVDAFKIGQVSAAAIVWERYAFYGGALVEELEGKIPGIFLERICRVPEYRNGTTMKTLYRFK